MAGEPNNTPQNTPTPTSNVIHQAPVPPTPVTPQNPWGHGGFTPPYQMPQPQMQAPPQQAPLNLDSQIQVGGKTHTVNDLIKAQEAAAAAQETQNKYDSLVQGIGVLMNNDASDPAASAALKNVLMVGGFSADDADAYIEGLTQQQPAGSGDQPPQGQAPVPQPQGQTVTQQPNPNDQIIGQMIQHQIQERVNRNIGADEDLQRLLTQVGKDRGQEASDGLKAALTGMYNNYLQQAVAAAESRLGTNAVRSQIYSVLDSAEGEAKRLTREQAEVFYGSLDEIGKNPVGGNMFGDYNLDDTPVARPDFQWSQVGVNGVSGAVVENEMQKWGVDKLVRAANEAQNQRTGSVS